MGFEDVRHARPLASAGGNPAEGAAVVRRGSRAHAAMALLAAAVLSLAISGCGGSSAPAGSGTSTPPASDAASASALPDFSVQPPNIGEFILMDAKQQREYLANAKYAEVDYTEVNDDPSAYRYASSEKLGRFALARDRDLNELPSYVGEWIMSAGRDSGGDEAEVALAKVDDSERANQAVLSFVWNGDLSCEDLAKMAKEITGADHVVIYNDGAGPEGRLLSQGKFVGTCGLDNGSIYIGVMTPDHPDFSYYVEHFNKDSAEFANGLHDDYYDYYLE